MKEAAGESNMTVITIVLIGVIVAVGLLIVPKLMRQVKARSCCLELGGRPYHLFSNGRYVAGCRWNEDIDSNGIRSAYRSCKGTDYGGM